MFHFEVHQHFSGLSDEQYKGLVARLESLDRKVTTLMTDLEKLQAALKQIDTATTKQGDVLAQEAKTLQEISDDFDKLIASGKLPADLLTGAQALADRAGLIAEGLAKQAEFSKAIAAKVEDPVPTPIPEPTPAPAPEQP